MTAQELAGMLLVVPTLEVILEDEDGKRWIPDSVLALPAVGQVVIR